MTLQSDSWWSAPSSASDLSDEDEQSLDVAKVIPAAVARFAEQTGARPEAVTCFWATGSGWSLLLKAVEPLRMPAPSSRVATYRLDVGVYGELSSYEQLDLGEHRPDDIAELPGQPV